MARASSPVWKFASSPFKANSKLGASGLVSNADTKIPFGVTVVAPILEELAAEYEGEIYVYKVNTEQEQELAALFNIRSIPSFLFIPMNDKPQMAMGAMPKSSFKEAIDGVLLKK